VSRVVDVLLQLFDAVIVLTSFSLDLVFIQGITGPQSQEAIALLIIFLLWRILRIINGSYAKSLTIKPVVLIKQAKSRHRRLIMQQSTVNEGPLLQAASNA